MHFKTPNLNGAIQCEENNAKFSRTVSAQSLPPAGIDTRINRKNNSEGDESSDSIYHSTLHMMANDMNYQREVSLGKRVGFYRIGKELGSGNFSKVKLAIHVLTKGINKN